MARELTERQREVLDFIKDFIKSEGHPPTVREIGAYFGFAPRSITDHLNAIEKKGYIRRKSLKPRSLEVLEFSGRENLVPWLQEVPILGRVAAGAPLLAMENIQGSLPVAREWAGGEEAFLLKVKGDSMIGAHILDGDLVLVRRQPWADDGDIVVALVGEEATVKRFYFGENQVELHPENPSMQPIIVRRGDRTLQILGRVIGVFRRLR